MTQLDLQTHNNKWYVLEYYYYCSGQNISEVYSHCGNKTNMKTHSNEQVLKALSKKSSLKKAFGRRVMTKKKGKWASVMLYSDPQKKHV